MMHRYKHNIINILFSALLILGISACNDAKDGATSPENIIGVAPIANAGADQTIIRGNSIILDGGASTDPDGSDDALSYVWDLGALGQKTGEVVEGNIPSNIPAGTYTVTLSVTDAEGNVAVDTMTITVENPPPSPRPPVVVTPVVETPVVETPVVEDVNTAPVAVANKVTMSCIDATLTIVLGATDTEGDTLTYRIVQQPTYSFGSVSVSGNVATYMNGAAGTDLCYGAFTQVDDSFSFIANDGTVDSNEVVVNVTITPPSGIQ